MSVQSEIDRIITAVGNAYSKISEKGGTVPASQTVANLATAIDSIPSVGTKETWVIKSSAAGAFETTQIAFTSNGQKYTSIGGVYDDSGTYMILRYDNEEVAGIDIMGGGVAYEFYDDAHRTLTFDTPPTGALLTWLQSNAVKKPDGGAADGPGFKVTFPATAANWNTTTTGSSIVQADGTVVNIRNYSTLARKTIPNVIEIFICGTGFYFPRMTVQTGKIMFTYASTASLEAQIVVDGETSRTYMSPSMSARFMPLADTVISKIEMYNTD